MATRTVSTKLAIEGESEYRASLTRINSEIKTLQSALKLTESQYQTNANSMAALTAKGEALSNLYKSQESKVKELRAALENAKKAEQEYADKKADLQAKIEANNQALEKLKATTGNTAAEEKKLTEENANLNKELESNEANLSAASQGVNSWQTQLNNAESKLNDLDAEIQKNDKYLDEAKESTDGCAASIDEYGNEVSESTNAVNDLNDALAAAGLITALKATADALEACVSAAADFEYAMSNVEAISGATADEMVNLNAKAKEIGATTMYTAQQAADAMGYMALAGWSATEMVDGIDGVISLAAASGEDLAQVSDIVTDSLTAFGLSAKDTNGFVDKLAATAANSNTTVAMLGEAFKYAAPVAGALGYSIEDVAVAMGLMANNGIKGSMAGTSLRNMFSALAGEVKLSAGAFGDVTIETTNADGSMKTFAETLDDLKFYFDQMTQAEQINNAQTLVGTRAYAGLLAILNTTADDYDSLTASIQNSTGAAKAMADIKMDNLTGQVTLMKSAWDAVKIAVGEQLLPVLTDVVSAGTDVLTWTADMIEKNEWLAPAITAVATALGIMAGAIAAYVVVQKVATAASAAFTAILDTNPIFLAITAVAALAAGIGILVATLKDDAVPSVKELTTAAAAMEETFEASNSKYEQTSTAIEGTALMAEKYIARLKELEAQGLSTNEAQEEYSLIVEKLRSILPDVNIVLDKQTGLIIGGTDALLEQVDAWKSVALQEALTTKYKDQIDAWAAAELEVYENQIKLNNAVADGQIMQDKYNSLVEEYTAIGEQMVALYNDETLSVSELADADMNLQEQQFALDAQLRELADDIESNADLQENLNEAIEAGSAVVAENEAAVTEAQKALESFTDSEGDAAAGADELAEALDEENATVAEIKTAMADLAESYKKSYDAAYESISGQTGLFNEFAATVSEDTATVEQMMDIWAKQTENLASYTENLRLAAQYGLDEGLILSLSDGSTESAGYISTIIDKITELGGSTEGLSTEAAAFVDDFNAAFARTEEAKDAFATTVATIETDFDTAVANLEQTAAEVDFSGFTEAMEEAFSNVGVDFNTIGKDAGSGLSNGIKSTAGSVSSASRDMAKGGMDAARTEFDGSDDLGEDFVEGVVSGIKSQESELRSCVSSTFDEINRDTSDKVKETVRVVTEEFGRLPNAVRQKVQELKTAVTSEMSAMPSSAMSIGEQIVNGMISGMNNRSSSLYYTIRNIVNTAILAAKSAAATASPSKKTTKIFEDVGEGMVVGLEHKRDKVAETAQNVVDEALSLDVSDKLDRAFREIDDVMPEVRTPRAKGGDTKYEYNIDVHMNGVTVREEADVEKISDALYRKIQTETRSRGGSGVW